MDSTTKQQALDSLKQLQAGMEGMVTTLTGIADVLTNDIKKKSPKDALKLAEELKKIDLGKPTGDFNSILDQIKKSFEV